ncbi:MAG: DNA polymerase I [Phycisphaeraceae bacterium]|nr:DNA polymerase I [Phycisphaeraceae bacterium]
MPTSAPPNTFYLIDGFAQMFRSYYAIRNGMNSPVTGEPTNATFAFTDMLLKIYRDYHPAYLAMAMESKGKTFRDEFYPEYKATRDPAPEDFKQQVTRMIEIARAFGVTILQAERYEADDIMATLAHQTQQGGFDDLAPGLLLRMVSKDKDLEQVLSDRVVLFDAHKDEVLDASALKEKRGITPRQAIDYQTLIGDSTDNVPGVKGIGPKTASKLIQQFGSVDELCKNVDQLKGKQKENIQTAIDTGGIDLSRRLVTMATDVELGFDLKDAETEGTSKIDGPKLKELFRELGFGRMQGDLAKLLGEEAEQGKPHAEAQSRKGKTEEKEEEAGFGLFANHGDGDSEGAAEPAREANKNYTAVKTESGLKELVAKLKAQPLIAVDTETIGLGHHAELCGICLSWEEGSGVYVPTKSPETDKHLDTQQVLDALRPVLEDASIPKCGHNIKYDDLVLRNAGLRMHGVVFDSMIGAFLAGAPGIGMDNLALSELGHACIPISELIGPKPRRKTDPPQKTMDQIPLDIVAQYAAEDADITLRLCNKLKTGLDEQGMTELYETIEMPLVHVLATMEQHGIRVMPGILDAQRDALQERIDELRKDILDRAKADFNPDSPKQLGEVLFNQLGFKAIKKTKTGFSTNSEVLEKLDAMTAEELQAVPEDARPIPGLMIEYRMLTKLVGTYLVALKEAIADDGRVHARFNQTGAATGRLSSSDPNLQNIPIRTEVGRDIRKAFVADPGHKLIAADYSQIELRVLAHLSEDEALIDAFNKGQDIHAAVAAQVFGADPDEVTKEQRNRAKVINFGIIYGITAYGLARRIDDLDNKAASALIDDYKHRFPGIDRFLNECIEKAKTDGYVETILGRRRAIPGIHERNGQLRALAERLAINSVVQGSAADLIKLAMVNLQQRIDREQLPAKLLLQIHDELVIETPTNQADAMAEVLVEEMRNAMALKVPLDVEAGIGEDWFGAK